MTSKSSRKGFGMACFASVTFLFLFPISSVSSSSSFSPSEKPEEILAQLLSLKHEANKQKQHHNRFESIWKSLKDLVDSSTKKNVQASSPSSSEKDLISLKQQQQQQLVRDVANRRGFLMEQSLNEHYTRQFLEHWPKEYNENLQLFEPNRKDTTIVPTLEPTKSVGGIRWRQLDKRGKTCYCFSESPDSYWSFQWCPESQTVHQGRRQPNGFLQQEHNLGSVRVRTTQEEEQSIETWNTVRHMIQHAETLYPTAASTLLFVNGDSCVKRGSLQRSSIVVLHESTSVKCSSREGTEMVIESVDEIQVCQYMFHVCKNRPTESPYNGADDSDDNKIINKDIDRGEEIEDSSSAWSRHPLGMEEINETLHYIQHHVTGSYARKARADAEGTTRESLLASLRSALPPLPQTRVHSNRKLIQDMFVHAYDSYMYHGYPASEVKPISCKPADFNLVKIPGLTLIDSLDTLVVLGNYTEFARAVERLRYLNDNMHEATGLYTPTGGGLFGINYNVSVFETNIRVLGGLLSAHQLAEAFLQGEVLKEDIWGDDNNVLVGGLPSKGKKGGCANEKEVDTDMLRSDCGATRSMLHCKQESIPMAVCRNETNRRHWVYDGFLLELARDIGDRLLPAFNTETGIPYGTVNLLSGVPEGETPIASLAGGGTLSIEMEVLSRLTNNSEYGRAAKLATRALWMRRSNLGLLGKHICTRKGHWTETLSGIGSNSDSFYEYLIKHHILFPEDADFWPQLVAAYGGLYNETRMGEWYGDVDMFRGKAQNGAPQKVLEALMAFYPGMQVLLGEVTPAARTLNSFFLAREYVGFLPERFHFGMWKVDHGGGTHLLRPELLESAYFLHRSSKGIQNHFRRGDSNDGPSDSSGWLWSGDFALHSTEKLTRSECGYASIRQVSPETSGRLQPERDEVRLLDEMPSYFLTETLKYLFLLFDDENILHTDEERDWVFTTEAHPVHHERIGPSIETKLREQKEDLRLRIKNRLAKKVKVENDIRESFTEEKWTGISKMDDFVDQINPLMTNDRETYKTRRDFENHISKASPSISTATERVFSHDSSWSPFDYFSERGHMLNPTYLSFQKLGNELRLTNSCPNLYSSNFLWIRAINGGITDYSDAYKSRTIDSFLASENDVIELGSVDALGLHGTGVHIESLYRAFFQCPLLDAKTSKANTKSDTETNGKRKGDLGDGSTRFDMGDGMGSFDISAFPGGVGFSTEHVESGETIVTTLIENPSGDTTAGHLVLVYAKNGQDSSLEDIVVLSDIEGNSYKCAVEIFESVLGPEGNVETCDAGENEESICDVMEATDHKIVRRFPCSIGLFGPTNISNLNKVKNLEVTGNIQTPDVGDVHGCGRFSVQFNSDDKTEPPKAPNFAEVNKAGIPIVRRGDCTFQEKSFNKKETDLAEGIIVINSDEVDDLFVMSGGGSSELDNLSDPEYPVTVLVSSSDGQQILELLNPPDGIDVPNLSARISIVHDKISDDSEPEKFTEKDVKFWPRVRAGPETIEVYSQSGWSVQADKVVIDDARGVQEVQWQMYLTKYDKGHAEAVP